MKLWRLWLLWLLWSLSADARAWLEAAMDAETIAESFPPRGFGSPLALPCPA